jgi:hypothetical protein
MSFAYSNGGVKGSLMGQRQERCNGHAQGLGRRHRVLSCSILLLQIHVRSTLLRIALFPFASLTRTNLFLRTRAGVTAVGGEGDDAGERYHHHHLLPCRRRSCQARPGAGASPQLQPFLDI